MSLISGKRVPFFFLENVSSLEKTGKGVFSGASSQHFLKKGVFFSSVSISEGVIFLFEERSYILHYACEWPDPGCAPPPFKE